MGAGIAVLILAIAIVWAYVGCVAGSKGLQLGSEERTTQQVKQEQEAQDVGGDVQQWSIGSVALNGGGLAAAVVLIGVGVYLGWSRRVHRSALDRVIDAIEQEKSTPTAAVIKGWVRAGGEDLPGRIIARRVRKVAK